MTPDEVVAALRAAPADLDDTVAALPGAPGLYAWWRDEELVGVGAARMLRNRIRRQDLYRTGVSRLRRVLAGTLLDELDLHPVRAADVILPRAEEDRLTAWMRGRLRLTVLPGLPDDEAARLRAPVASLLGPAEVDSDAAAAAEARFVAAAGERVPREVGVPFQRP